MWLEKLRLQLAYPKTSVQLSLLGLLVGLLASAIIIAFRSAIENIQLIYLENPDDFSTLSDLERFALPFVGIVFVLLVAKWTKFKHQRTGIPFVIYRMKSFYGMMPFKNTLNQFFAGIAAMATGFCVGREGPSVHLGAASASALSRSLKLPYNSIKTLTACGIAAGISASFNTPLAAVIFVMEVVLREYKIHVFIPIMLASVTGAIATRWFYGDYHDLGELQIHALDLIHYPYLLFMGLAIGAFAFAFNRQLIEMLRSFKPIGMVPRLLLAALMTALIGYFVPLAMGTGIAGINLIDLVTTETNLLIIIFVSKALLTFFAISLGVPGGIIGPIMALGMLFGAILAALGALFIGNPEGFVETYGVIALAGLMAATLNAPLAALLTVLELTHNPDIILPAMLVIVTAHITSSQLFRNRSIFILQLEFQKLDYQTPPAYEALQKIGISADMRRNFILVEDNDPDVIRNALDRAGKRPVILKSVTELDTTFKLVHYDVSLDYNKDSLFSFEDMLAVDSRYTLAEPFELLHLKRDGWVYVYTETLDNIVGVMSWEDVRKRLIKGTL
ncbi:chloride channel protein [Catenovulum sp. SM1970]|uniref:chloride channel protein n=1 Tax=Marinifaba aquimaris TaxID=2741323 RepID=UPI001571B77A|nr:chloride channel protein [Marinifaba aquimaris]NTS78391.1 chloride channel protein [Marinifaba aquimaris]